MIVPALALGVVLGICLGALGAGGSIVTVPALVYLLGQSVSSAITESLTIVSVSSAVAAIAHVRAGHVRWRTGTGIAIAGAGAAWGGTELSGLVPAGAAMAAFATLILVVAYALQWQPPVAREARDNGLTGKILATGVLIGLLTGFFGVGGGFVIVPVLIYFLGYSLQTAVGTSLFIISVNSVIGLLARLDHQAPDWSIVLPIAVAAIAGSLVGKWLASKISEVTLRKVFTVALVTVAAYIGVRSAGMLT
ncbi:sulfite exporter TauE/SafE family protein [Nocardia brasiliensis]|uniref:sulfite exporter TauE/SafE family protein n=1 Tax=Nocardia brasiliensis TaxID=37326 RepID=UPI00245591A0|nr:sulfite exporter TauE/SafE family protein [Nocardia brasiliensis]